LQVKQALHNISSFFTRSSFFIFFGRRFRKAEVREKERERKIATNVKSQFREAAAAAASSLVDSQYCE
jgi:hypothetical protein